MERDNNSSDMQGALYLFGGIALVIFGAGLLASHPAVKKYLGHIGAGDLIQAAIPDVERYLKLRAM